MSRVRVSRSFATQIDGENIQSIGASYSHIESFGKAIGPNTKSVIAEHAMLRNLDGFENAGNDSFIERCFLACNLIREFRPADRNLPKFGILDLKCNPIESLANIPKCDELIVSGTKIKNLIGLQDGIKIVRCNH